MSANPLKLKGMNILLLQGTGNAEAEMARSCSRFGRVVLVESGICRRVEVWENEERVHTEPDLPIRFPRLHDITFGLIKGWGAFRAALRLRQGKKYDVVVGTAYDNGNVALFLRWLGVARRVVVLVCDYLPIKNVPFTIWCHRHVAGWLTKNNLRRADSVWLVSPRIPTPGRADGRVMPLFIANFDGSPKSKKAIAYVGYPTPEHGLDVLCDISARHGIEVHLFGPVSGFESIIAGRKRDLIHLHGVVTGRARLHGLIKDCFCGYAVYNNVSPDSFLYYGVWSKIYTYLASKLPVITTPGSYTSDVVQQNNIGKVVPPDPASIEKAVLELWEEHEQYQADLEKFVPKWNQGAEDFWAAQIGKLASPGRPDRDP